MSKLYCDCCGKETYVLEWVRVGYRILVICKSCQKTYDKIKNNAIRTATKEFFEKKGRMDILEEGYEADIH